MTNSMVENQGSKLTHVALEQIRQMLEATIAPVIAEIKAMNAGFNSNSSSARFDTKQSGFRSSSLVPKEGGTLSRLSMRGQK